MTNPNCKELVSHAFIHQILIWHHRCVTAGVLHVEMARPSTCSWGSLSDRQEKDAIDKYLHHRVAGAIEKQSVDNEGRVSP